MTGQLEGKTAIITGGCSGIGLATVERFISEGANVVVIDLLEEKGQALEGEFSGKLKFVAGSVVEEAVLANAVSLAKESFGGLDILVNNAGWGGHSTSILETDFSDWDQVFDICLKSAVMGIKHAAPIMMESGGGSVVNVASIAGLEAGWGLPYSLSKAGVIHLSKVAAAELSKHNIRVNTVSPGVIVTPMFGVAAGLKRDDTHKIDDVLKTAAKKMQPLPTSGAAEHIANAILYLASDQSSFVTGTNHPVEGGITVGKEYSWDPDSPSHMLSALAHALAPNEGEG